jgi:hypothetical protein
LIFYSACFLPYFLLINLNQYAVIFITIIFYFFSLLVFIFGARVALIDPEDPIIKLQKEFKAKNMKFDE